MPAVETLHAHGVVAAPGIEDGRIAEAAGYAFRQRQKPGADKGGDVHARADEAGIPDVVFLGGRVAGHKIFLAQFETIKKIAEKESCVIVGRCADYALSDNPNCINVFIHADLDVRIKNVSRNLNITENKARDIINKTDKQRASYYNYYTSKKWGDSKSYNLSLDAGKLGTDNCVEMILKFRELMDAMK